MGQTQLNTFNNNFYNIGASKIKQVLWYYINVIFFSSKLLPINKLKLYLLNMFGCKLGVGVVIKPGVNIKYPWKLSIGNYTWIGEDVWIDNLDYVTIGDNCCLSQGVMLLCGNHNYKSSRFDLITLPITLENGVWIGAQSVVCPGVTCFSHSVLAVGSVTTKNLKAFTIYQGNPAIEVRSRVIES